MTAAAAVVAGIAVAVQLVAATLVLLADDALDRIHAVSLVSVLGTVVTVVAVSLAGHSTSHIAKTVSVGLVLWLASPFLGRATARAIRIRRTGELRATDGEREAGGAGS